MPRDTTTHPRGSAPRTLRTVRGLYEGPYNFVPVRPKAAAVTGEPQYHDGSSRDPATGHRSGELHCTLEALTPLFVGNEQIEHGDLSSTEKQAFDASWAPKGKIDGAKKFLYPFFVSRDGEEPGPILLSGAGIKGSVRTSVGALLSAPMERVRERTFSYRPTARLPRQGRVRVLAARVVGVGETLDIEAFPLDRLVWVKDDAAANAAVKAAFVNEKPVIQDVTLVRGRLKELIYQKGRPYPYENEGLDIQRCAKGLDGRGTFGQPSESDREQPKPGREWVLAPVRGEFERLKVSGDVVEQLKGTLEHIADKDHGHLANHPKTDLDKSLASARTKRLLSDFLTPGDDVVFVEVIGKEVVSIGLHLRYRFRYRDSVHLALSPGKSSRTASADDLRPEMSPLEEERCLTEDGRPEALSGARLLFGYVGPERDEYDPSNPDDILAFGIGRDDHRQLAGRIAINFAVEHLEGRTGGKERFLRPDTGCFVPLAPLSSPKPSAYEFYLERDPASLQKRRDGGLLNTWGDTVDDPSAGKLRGRKLYLHQPRAASDPSSYELDASAAGGGSDSALCSQQSGVCRYVSTPGTTFRFKLRFRDLADWELGALVLSMAPDEAIVRRFVQELGEAGRAAERELTKIPRDSDAPAFATKLGHGRPLGMGSVRIRVDAQRTLKEDVAGPDLGPADAGEELEELIGIWVAALAKRLREQVDLSVWVGEVFLPWLALHRFAGRGAYGYPRLETGHGEATSLAYHMEVHKLHGRGRQRSSPDREHLGALGLKAAEDYE